MWSWRDDVNNNCFISLICAKSCRRNCSTNLEIIGLLKMEISILISILGWISWKKPKQRLNRHIARFLNSEIPIYNSEVPDTTGRKTRRRKPQAIAKCFTFNKNYCFIPLSHYIYTKRKTVFYLCLGPTSILKLPRITLLWRLGMGGKICLMLPLWQFLGV